MLTPLPALLMHVVPVVFLVMKSLELGVTLQGFLQKSLRFSLRGWHVSLLLQNSFILLSALSELGQGQTASAYCLFDFSPLCLQV